MILINRKKGEELFRNALNPKFSGVQLETIFDKVREGFKDVPVNTFTGVDGNIEILEFIQLTSDNPFTTDAIEIMPEMLNLRTGVKDGEFTHIVYKNGHYVDNLLLDIQSKKYKGNNIYLGMGQSVAYSVDIQAENKTLINYWIEPLLAYFFILEGALSLGDIEFKRDHVSALDFKAYKGFVELNTVREIQGINKAIARELSNVEKHLNILRHYLVEPIATLDDNEVNDYSTVMAFIEYKDILEWSNKDMKVLSRQAYLYLLKTWLDILNNTQRHLAKQIIVPTVKLRKKLHIVEDLPKESAFYVAGSKLN